METLIRQQLFAAREIRYRRRMNLRVTTQVEAVEFVKDVGFAFLFPIQKAEKIEGQFTQRRELSDLRLRRVFSFWLGRQTGRI